ncbi:MAG: Fis family transcriptional regulator [Deltaproteobacteria bacterium]
MHPDVFTAAWAAAWRRELNASPVYREKAAGWEGAVALQMTADPALGVSEARAVWLDLHHGACREARAATPEDLAAAAYLIDAEPAVWKDVLGGRLSPIGALLGGRLRLLRGSVMSLVPYVAAAQELLVTATLVQQQFPDAG